MKRLPIILGGVLFLWCVGAFAHDDAVTMNPPDDESDRPPIDAVVLSQPPAPTTFGLARADPDTVYLVGGPGALSGKFQTMVGWPGGNADAQGWTGVDVTEPSIYWHLSTFNAESFGGTAIPNHAMWSGVPAGTPGYAAAPGYGNNWDDNLVFAEAINGSQTNTARLQFQFHYDTETNWDFFTVDYDSAGTWVNLATYTGISDTLFVTPAVFDETVVINPGMGGSSGNQLHYRLRVLSDGNTSDEDGFVDTQGAAQVDNIRVTVNGTEISFADFDGSAGSADWTPVQGEFVGDFAKLFQQFQDIDPCRSNVTPLWGFIDDGRSPSNAPGETTGGSLSSNWDYGIPGGWVTNFTGGLAGSGYYLHDEIWSPEIVWDLPGTEDDAAVGGAFLRFSIYQHLPRTMGFRWLWGVRSYPNESGEWTTWRDNGNWYYSDTARWSNIQFDVSDLIVADPEKVQISFAIWDVTGFFPQYGDDGTPSPLFDNVSFARYRIAGPTIGAGDLLDHFNDAFPQSGLAYAAATDSLDMAIRLDAAIERVRTQGSNIVAGDSMTVLATAVVPGTVLVGPPTMTWVLDANPLFDDARTLPAGASMLGTFTGPDGRTWNRWTGTEIGIATLNQAGTPIEDTYHFDLPDGRARRHIVEADEPGMFYPGDELRWYFRAEDSGGNVTTAPADVVVGEFQDGSWGPANVVRPYEVHGLPSYYDPTGTGVIEHPALLFINDFGHRGSANDFVMGFEQNGLYEGVDWDCYTVVRPDANLSNSIGSSGSWGANADQLDGYEIILYDSGNLASLSDGTVGENKATDVQVLTQWKNRPGDRFTAYFGEDVAASLANAGIDAANYLTTVMGVNYVGSDANSSIGGQTTPVVVPTGDVTGFSYEFIAFGGCANGIRDYDDIRPLAGAVASHEFTSEAGLTGVYDPAAAVFYDRNPGDGRKVDMTIPIGISILANASLGSGDPPKSAVAKVLDEVLSVFGMVIDDSDATGTNTPALPSKMLGSHPNPFNPKTQIDLRMGVVGTFTLRIYNVRGELVRTLLNEEMQPGSRSITWDGTDHQGRLVGSGVYLTKFTGPDVDDAGKILLIK